MAEVIMEADTGRKRRLPTWMLGVSAADKLGSSVVVDGKSETKAAKSKVKSIARRPDIEPLVPETDGSKRAGRSQMGESERRTKKVSRRNSDPNSSISSCDEAVLPQKKLKKEASGRQKHAASRKQNRKSCGTKNSGVEAMYQGSSGDEIELTVEDLVSIAEEYVNADREKQDGRVSNESTGCSQALSRCTTTRCSSHLSEIGRKGKESPPVENAMTNIVRTGDVARDMLDLFLGPLLKKPQAEAQDLRIARVESINLVPEPKKQVRSMPERNEETILTKKKSSLKDKVSVYLN